MWNAFFIALMSVWVILLPDVTSFDVRSMGSKLIRMFSVRRGTKSAWKFVPCNAPQLVLICMLFQLNEVKKECFMNLSAKPKNNHFDALHNKQQKKKRAEN